ncbi:MAG: MOSC domain-containing protein [Halolamina sp.]
MPTVSALRRYPVKGLDGVTVETCALRAGGTLAGDREFALVDPDGRVLNAKDAATFHEVDADYDPETTTLTVVGPDGDRAAFDLARDDDRDAAGEWFAAALNLDCDARLARDADAGFVDRGGAGPSVVSTATLEAIADWFDELTTAGVRRRLRANVEVGGVEPFWEDRFVGDDAPAFAVDGVRFEGATPCARCVVPSRDPDTGESLAGFRERFVDRRRETFPEFADRDAFDHLYALMLIARVPAPAGATLAVGDAVDVVE